jgi:hypothetical protein
MSLSYWSRVAALALLPLAAMAQQGKEASPADPDAPVLASEYISVFRNYRAAPDAQPTPDGCNQAVGPNSLESAA